MSKFIKNIFNQFRGELLLIYFYILIAHLSYLFEPYILGKMIDGLLVKEYTWLCIFLGVALLSNAFMYKRMVYDTKVYTTIYNTIILKFLNKNKHTDFSQRIARTEMANNIVNFLEDDIQYYIISILSIIGTLFFIFLEDITTGFVVASCAIPITIIVKLLYRKIKQATQTANNHYEQKADMLASNDESLIETFFKRRKKVLVMSSTLQGKNWVSLNTTKTIFLVASLIIVTTNNVGISQGEAVAIYQYINNFLISLMSIPVSVETFTRLNDVIKRIN